MDTRLVKLKELKSNRHNPRKIDDAKFNRLIESVLVFPKMLSVRPIVVNEDMVVLGGNMRLKALRHIATLDAGEIQQRLFNVADYKRMGGVARANVLQFWVDWLEDKTIDVADASTFTEEEQKQFVVKDNASFGEWDMEEFDKPEWDGYDLEAWGMADFERTAPQGYQINDAHADDYGEGYEPEEEDESIDVSGEDYEGEDGAAYEGEGDEGYDDEPSFADKMYKDVLYESDNELEIPNLLLSKQAGKLELPLNTWGANSRLRTDITTYHFYVDDYRFEALFKDPSKLIASGCKAIVEPNCSLHDQTPIAFGLNQIYKKRYLSRYCQECGITVYVDLNVAEKFREYNRMGVPKGYNAFMTRGLDGWMESLANDLKEAQEISGLEVPNLIVYGGGKKVKEFCQAHSLLYVTDFINAKKLD